MRQGLAAFFLKMVFYGAAAGALSCVESTENVENTKAACNAVISIACKKAFECAPPEEFDSIDTCIAKSTETQCPEAEIRAVEADFRAQGKKVDLSALEHCEASYREATCADYHLGIPCDFAIRHK